MTTIDGRTTITVARMLREAASIRQVAEHTGLTEEQVRQLARDIPGLPNGRAVPVSTGTSTGPAPITELPTRVLAAHPANIRNDLGDLRELADTVREHGILQALLVTRGDHGTYVILDGHRRLGAAILADLPRVPVTVRPPVDDEQATIVMLVTGLQKMNLDPIDEALAYRRLEQHGYKQKQIAELVGKNQGHVSQRLALLNLTHAEQAAVRRREITVDAAYKTGRDRSSRRMDGPQARPKPKRVLHFNNHHPAATAAGDRCRRAGHEVLLKLGPACGPCWEAELRQRVLEEHAIDCPIAARELEWPTPAEQHLVDAREGADA